ncbi:MAG: hypothetical protein AAF629_15715 [Chloroflexota bacterium]
MLFGSVILEVAISIVFIYILLSLICSTLKEGVSRVLGLRAATLEAGIYNLLDDKEQPGLVNDFYDHVLISSLAYTGFLDKLGGQKGKPSYIPAKTFATVVLDLLVPTDKDGGSKTVDSVRKALSDLPDGRLKKSLVLLVDEAGDNLEQTGKNIEDWFNNTMDRASGWYKRRAQLIILIWGIVISFTLNIDTLQLANALYQDVGLRSVVVSSAEGLAASNSLPNNLDTLTEDLESLQLPIGWEWDTEATEERDIMRQLPTTPRDWFYKLIGLIFTTAAISLGAPFWFDVLTKLTNLRATGKKPESNG